jgi:hypothetical protein
VVGTLRKITFAAQWLACAFPCRRFAATLADDCARLGANADRYSFIAADSHRLLLAGLPAHKFLILIALESAWWFRAPNTEESPSIDLVPSTLGES